MKNFLSILVLGLVALTMNSCMYNSLVSSEEAVEAAWSQVENQYQRRADLVPNLVATVKGYAAHEQETLQGVVDARAKATQITIDPANATPEQLAAFQAAQGELSQALGRLLAVAENYPDLKANENFRDLQAQLEGTENRIAVARQEFNETARAYNQKVRRFPSNIVAMIFGFEKKPYFEAEAGAQSAPTVAF
ncbi:MAG: LemA family protein [Paludibacteraceae bacterium]|nr:LemA family protein [Paludibacteraceae bacterium]